MILMLILYIQIENNSDIDRIHLVLDIKPTSEILKKLNII